MATLDIGYLIKIDTDVESKIKNIFKNRHCNFTEMH